MQNPILAMKYSKMIESELNQRFKFILKGTPDAQEAMEVRFNFRSLVAPTSDLRYIVCDN